MTSLWACAWLREPRAKHIAYSQDLNFSHEDYPAADVQMCSVHKAACVQFVRNQHMEEHTYGKMMPGGSVSEMLLNRRPTKTCLIYITLDGTKLFSLGRKAEHGLFCVYGWER